MSSEVSPTSVADYELMARDVRGQGGEADAQRAVRDSARIISLLALMICTTSCCSTLLPWWPVVLASCCIHWLLFLEAPELKPVVLVRGLARGGWVVILVLRIAIHGEPLPLLDGSLRWLFGCVLDQLARLHDTDDAGDAERLSTPTIRSRVHASGRAEAPDQGSLGGGAGREMIGREPARERHVDNKRGARGARVARGMQARVAVPPPPPCIGWRGDARVGGGVWVWHVALECALNLDIISCALSRAVTRGGVQQVGQHCAVPVYANRVAVLNVLAMFLLTKALLRSGPVGTYGAAVRLLSLQRRLRFLFAIFAVLVGVASFTWLLVPDVMDGREPGGLSLVLVTAFVTMLFGSHSVWGLSFAKVASQGGRARGDTARIRWQKAKEREGHYGHELNHDESDCRALHALTKSSPSTPDPIPVFGRQGEWDGEIRKKVD